MPVLLTYLVLQLILLPATNLSFSSLELTYEDVAQSFLSSPKAYILLLTTALVAAHVGSVLAKRLPAERRHRAVAISFGIALLLVVIGIPWPFGAVARPWLTLPL